MGEERREEGRGGEGTGGERRGETKNVHVSILAFMRVPHPGGFIEDSSVKSSVTTSASSGMKNSKLVFQQAFKELDNGDTLTDK